MKIFQSATKIVLLIFTLAITIGIFSGHVEQETFKTAVLMVLTYYFTKAQTVMEAKSESGQSTDVISALESLKE